MTKQTNPEEQSIGLSDHSSSTPATQQSDNENLSHAYEEQSIDVFDSISSTPASPQSDDEKPSPIHDEMRTLLCEAINSNKSSIIKIVKIYAFDSRILTDLNDQLTNTKLKELCNYIINCAINYLESDEPVRKGEIETYYYARLIETLSRDYLGTIDPTYGLEISKYAISFLQIIIIRNNHPFAYYQLARLFALGIDNAFIDESDNQVKACPQTEIAFKYYQKAACSIDTSHPETKTFQSDYANFCIEAAIEFHEQLILNMASLTYSVSIRRA